MQFDIPLLTHAFNCGSSGTHLHPSDYAVMDLTFPSLVQQDLTKDLARIWQTPRWTVSLVSLTSPPNKPTNRKYGVVHREPLLLPSNHHFLFQVLIDLLCNNSP